MNNWIEIDEAALAANFGVLQRAAGDGTEILAVVKANAYGHGAEQCAQVLVRAGARWLGVTSALEGARVRRALGDAAVQVLVMSGFLPEDVALMEQHCLTPTLWTREQVEWLAASAMPVHVEVDTGMGRQGVLPGAELAELLEWMAAQGVAVEGIFTHFCSSEEAACELTQRQQRLFESAVAEVRAAGLKPRWVHAGNSSTVDNPAPPHAWLAGLAASVGARAMVRTGLALYGYALPIEGDAVPQVRELLKPVMTWKAKVLAVRELAVGETVGYNATFTAEFPMRVAVIAAGYADGLRRELSSSDGVAVGWVMVRGQHAGIVGRVSMNLTVVDVTEIDGVVAGDEAVLLGPGVTAEDHAALAMTIAYEILCGVRPCG